MNPFPTHTQGLLTPLDVSRLLCIPESTLSVWRSTRRVKLAFVKVGRAVRYRRDDIDRLMVGSLDGNDAA